MYLRHIRKSILVGNCHFYHTENGFGFRKRSVKRHEVPVEVIEDRNKESNFYRLVTAYREQAHRIAKVNPVDFNKEPLRLLPELNPVTYGFGENDQVHFVNIIHNNKHKGTIDEAVEYLNQTYCQDISPEFSYLEENEKEWFSKTYEKTIQECLNEKEKIEIAKALLRSEVFDNFLAKKFPTVKRYGGEGAESMLAFFREFFNLCAYDDIQTVVLGIPHRGRLNLLTGLLNLPPAKIFRKLRGFPDFPTKFQSTGDVVSHFISSTELNINDKKLNVTVLYNPSHLEVVNPVSMGKTRAKQMTHKDGAYSDDETSRWSDKIINVQVHGDAALAGQGVNYEMLNFSNLPHFEVGGSVHFVVNNQVGFTTPSYMGKSGMYSTDVAKVISAPVLHVNGDNPEAILKATRIAFSYQREFRKDVFIDMICYRQWGHNELDDPTFTNPALYKVIRSKRTVPQKYAEELIAQNIITQGQVDSIRFQHESWLNNYLSNAESYDPPDPCFQKQWFGFQQAEHQITTWETGLNTDLIKYIGAKSVELPDNFKIHQHLLKTHVNSRLGKIQSGTGIDWATAEAIAMGSLLFEGYNVRISGQDVGRATFSHRHAMFVDQETNKTYVPLNHIDPEQKGFLEVANSILSEEAVLAFEYGMSVENPNNLIIWEAQFGDFFNGAQIIFDTFISSGEAKWLWSSGLVVLLPHGYDGAGPEHSSCRLERFLQMTDSKEDAVDGDNINMQICQPSTSAQYFHLLRRQMVRNYRKPLIIVMPKSLLRLADSACTVTDLSEGTSFQPVLGDTSGLNPLNVEKVIFTSGKHYYTLKTEQKQQKIKNTAIVRIESFCPFPTMELQQEIGKYSNAKMFLWCQEEPQNMGSWTYLKPRFENLLGKRLKFIGRKTSASPAVGVAKWHQAEVEYITKEPFRITLNTAIKT